MEPIVRVVCEGCLRSVEVPGDGTDSGASRCPHCGRVVDNPSSRVGSSEADSQSPKSPPDSQSTELGEKINWYRTWERGTLGSLGRFQLRERIGDGGFGQVFLA